MTNPARCPSADFAAIRSVQEYCVGHCKTDASEVHSAQKDLPAPHPVGTTVPRTNRALRKICARARRGVAVAGRRRSAAMRTMPLATDALLRYELRWPVAAPPPSATFVQLSRDPATDAFLERAATTAKMGWLRTRLHRVLRKFRSDFDVNGLLDAYPLHLFSTAQLQQLLLGAGAPASFSTGLDVGAGVGLVTDELRPVCENIVTTETSQGMVRRLRSAGYECWEEDLAQTVGGRLDGNGAEDSGVVVSNTRAQAVGTFELVSILNVIDRSRQPAGLLRAAHRLLDLERGWLLLATPLPYRPFYYEGARTFAPVAQESLALPRARQWTPSPNSTEDEEWALGAERLLNRVLPSQGFEVVAFSRIPYISAGDADDDLAYLDDILLLARPVGRKDVEVAK